MDLPIGNLFLSVPSLALGVFLIILYLSRSILLGRVHKEASVFSYLELFAALAIEVGFMVFWTKHMGLFSGVMLLLAGFFICFGLSLLFHMVVLRNAKVKPFNQSLILCALFFPGALVFEAIAKLFG